MRIKPFIVKEDILGEKPVYHLFYANETKEKSFNTRQQALNYKNKYLK